MRNKSLFSKIEHLDRRTEHLSGELGDLFSDHIQIVFQKRQKLNRLLKFKNRSHLNSTRARKKILSLEWRLRAEVLKKTGELEAYLA